MGANGLEYKKKLLMKTPDVEVWLVNGQKVRNNLSIEFVEGSHGYAPSHKRIVPENEIWVDDCLSPQEYTPVIVHELYERELMKKGMGYKPAHDRANLVELKVRRKPKTGKKVLVRHGLKPYWCNKCSDYHSHKDKLYEKHIKYNHTN